MSLSGRITRMVLARGRRTRVLLAAAILALGPSLVGWTPWGPASQVWAECERDVGEIAIVGTIGDIVIVDVERGKDVRLVRTDGTTAGTATIARGLHPGPGVTMGDASYFLADDGEHGPELWRSDGTAEGTLLVKDIRRARGESDNAFGSIVSVGATLYLVVDDGEHGPELWRSDGTAEGTLLVKDIRPGPEGSMSSRTAWPWFGSNTTMLGDALMFAAVDGEGVIGLWRSDGTPERTSLVRSFPPDTTTSDPSTRPGRRGALEDPRASKGKLWGLAPLAVVGGTLYFSVGSRQVGQLWRTDGTPAGTSIVTDPAGAPIGTPLADSGGTAVVGETLYVVPGDRTMGAGPDLWRTDGTPEGTTLVMRFAPGPEGWGPTGLTALDDALFFTADDGEHGRELWRTDGTLDGTTMVRDIRPGPKGSQSYGELTPMGGTLYFGADDGEHGGELWRSDGTAEGTVLVRDIRPGPRGWWPEVQAVVGQTLYLTFQDGVRLWRSDGTAEGTLLVKEANRTASDLSVGTTGGDQRVPTTVGDSVYFRVASCQLEELWRTNAVTDETVRLVRIRR